MTLWAFLNSQFLIVLTTFIVGSFVIFLYFKQKTDEKQNAAIVLVNEIRNAESSIQTVKDFLRDTGTVPDITVLPFNNWNKYSNYFAKDFGQDEMKIINKFYADAEKVGYNVAQVKNMFLIQVQNRSRAIQDTNLTIIDKAKDVKVAIAQLKSFEEKLWGEGVSTTPYVPKGFYDSLFKYLPEIQFVSSTTVGAKLRKIAKIK